LSYTVPTCEPDDITAGDSLEWDKTLPTFPASEGWELSYSLISKSGDGASADLDLPFGPSGVVEANGDVFEVRVGADDTADLVAGPYELIARVVNDAEGITKSWLVKRVLVHADPATVVGAKSHARTMRDLLRTALESAATDAEISIQVNGRSVTYDPEKARAQLAHYEYLVVLEENPTAEISHAAVFQRG
jgi:hypothetical protein